MCHRRAPHLNKPTFLFAGANRQSRVVRASARPRECGCFNRNEAKFRGDRKMMRAFKLYTGPDNAAHVLEGTIDEKDRTDVVADPQSTPLAQTYQ